LEIAIFWTIFKAVKTIRIMENAIVQSFIELPKYTSCQNITLGSFYKTFLFKDKIHETNLFPLYKKYDLGQLKEQMTTKYIEINYIQASAYVNIFSLMPKKTFDCFLIIIDIGEPRPYTFAKKGHIKNGLGVFLQFGLIYSCYYPSAYFYGAHL